jgi:hypothetical protein
MTPKNGYQNQEQDRRIKDLEDHWITLNGEFGCIKTNVDWLKEEFKKLGDKVDSLIGMIISGFVIVIIAQVLLKFFL